MKPLWRRVDFRDRSLAANVPLGCEQAYDDHLSIDRNQPEAIARKSSRHNYKKGS